MRDADAREVKIIKDLLIEDEEEAGAERERQFKWKNVNDSNWDDAKQLDDDAGGMRDSDDENEEAWRKMRYERELMLKDKEKLADLTATDTSVAFPSPLQLSTTNADTTTTTAVTRRRITIVKSAANTPPVNAKTDSPFLISRSSVLQVFERYFGNNF